MTLPKAFTKSSKIRPFLMSRQRLTYNFVKTEINHMCYVEQDSTDLHNKICSLEGIIALSYELDLVGSTFSDHVFNISEQLFSARQAYYSKASVEEIKSILQTI